ncbi:MAG TPA: NADH-quinone oxidoreductase subunit NuoG [Bacteroidales bacterium]|nr:NADH-quinone oxidoreductase subunit NuoG [Bacteroidales bacterium]
MVKIIVDGKSYEVKPDKNLLETCLSLGIDIPHFCYHPALGSVGACRLCAVKKFKDKDDKKGRIVMSCMEPVTEGLIVSVDDQDARSFRAAVIEGLMTNHPHDCPVCDEGGECHLQDMTIMSGHTYRRFDFPKRTYLNQDLGPFINHEMNRCIQCYRCVRFYRDYAGGKDLNVFSSRNHVYFGRHKDGALENAFSGNLVEVCPTGVFTDKTLKKHFTRKWDLSNAPSVCVHCSLGCNTIASERYGSLRRIMSRYNGAVNGYFICDRGRFGYEFVNIENRIKTAELRSDRSLSRQPVNNEDLFSYLNKSFSKKNNIIGIGSPRASLESNFALMTLAGKDNFYHGISKKEYLLTKIVTDYLQNSGIHIPSLKEIEKADVIFILGEDLKNTAPMVALAVRQAARNIPNEEAKKNHVPLWNDIPVRELGQNEISPIFIATTYNDSLDEIAEKTFRSSVQEIANLGNSVAGNIDKKAPDSKSELKDLPELAGKISTSLLNAKNPLIISGVSFGDEGIINAALNVASVLHSKGSNVMLSMILPECNSMGLALMPGLSFEDLENKETDTLIVLENDLYRRSGNDFVNALLNKSKEIIVLDHLNNKTTGKSDVLLPAAPFSESEGTMINNEGRAQRFYKAVENNDQVKESWKWLADFIQIRESDQSHSWNRMDDVVKSLAQELPVFSKLTKYLPDADFRMLNTKIPRQTMRYSGRTAMNANIAVSETGLPADPDSPLKFSMEGQQENPPSSLVPFYWTPGWNSVQALYNYVDEPDGSMKGGDPGFRLLETGHTDETRYYKPGIRNAEFRKDELQIFPLYQIFGSEELSSMSPSVSQKIQEPFLLLNEKDAVNTMVNDGDFVMLEVLNEKIKVKLKIGNGVQPGMAALSISLPGMPYLELPGSGKFHKL